MTAPVPGRTTPVSPSPPPGRRGPHWPEASTPLGAILYGIIGGLIVWLLVDVLTHVHIAITWH
jgi:hypothetical protein